MPASLMLHCGADGISQRELEKIKPPKPKGRWNPIGHAKLLGITKDVCKDLKLSIKDQRFGVSKDKHRFFGVLDLKGKGTGDKEVGLAIGLRNSTDKTLAASIAPGSRVFVCDNLAMHSDIIIKRKHLTNVEDSLRSALEGALGQYPQWVTEHRDMFSRWKKAELDDRDARDLIVETVKRDILPASRLPNVLSHWEDPKHAAFEKYSAWSLFNAFTEDFKEVLIRNPFAMTDRTVALTDLFNERFDPRNN